jgi:superfamily II DNA or RNA helicase
MQQVHSQGPDKLDSNYGISVFDECHVTSAADTMQDIGLSITTKWRFGLSATPRRANPGEDLEIEAAIGGVSSQVTAAHLIDNDYLAEPQFEFITGDFRSPKNDNYHQVVKRCIELAPNRNGAIATKATALAADGHSVLIPVDRINQGKLIEHALMGSNEQTIKDDLVDQDDDDADEIMLKMRAAENTPQPNNSGKLRFAYIDANASPSERKECYDALENGDLDILITTLIKEGADIPNISAIVHAEGGKSKTQRIQRIGRALRPQNGDKAIIVDVQDQGKFIGSHFRKRLEVLNEYYAEYGPTQSSDNTTRPLQRTF